MNWKFVKIMSDNSLRKITLFFVVGFSLFISCNNEHCDEVINTPLRIDLYKYSDTSQKATPKALIIQGIGTDSILDFSQESQINLPLNKNSNKSEYLIALMYDKEEWNTLKFITDNIFVDNATNDTLEVEKKVGDVYFTNGFNSAIYLSGNIDSVSYIYYTPLFDTLSIAYYNQNEFVSAECGCLSSQMLLNVEFKRDKIGDIELLHTLINNQNNEAQVKVFLNYY